MEQKELDPIFAAINEQEREEIAAVLADTGLSENTKKLRIASIRVKYAGAREVLRRVPVEKGKTDRPLQESHNLRRALHHCTTEFAGANDRYYYTSTTCVFERKDDGTAVFTLTVPPLPF